MLVNAGPAFLQNPHQVAVANSAKTAWVKVSETAFSPAVAKGARPVSIKKSEVSAVLKATFLRR